jgi:hypothetical protein
VAKVGTSNPDRTISLEGCSAKVENKPLYFGLQNNCQHADHGLDFIAVRLHYPSSWLSDSSIPVRHMESQPLQKAERALYQTCSILWQQEASNTQQTQGKLP